MTPPKSDLKGILLFLEHLYPLTIITDRYHGTYSGAEFLAFPLLHTQVPPAACGNDGDQLPFSTNPRPLPSLLQAIQSRLFRRHHPRRYLERNQ